MEKASRLYGLIFGRIIFEFGIPVVPDLSMEIGNRRSPAWSGTTAQAVLPLPDRGTVVGSPIPSYSFQILIHVGLFGGLCSFFHVVSSVSVFGSR